MDLSDKDIISKYYAPHELTIRKILSSICHKHHDVLISFIDVIDQNQLSNFAKKTIITDQSIRTDLYHGKIVLPLPDSVFGIYYIPESFQSQEIDRDFNLFMNRANPHRLFWFYKILEMGWLESGYVSYIGSTERSTHPEMSCTEFINHTHEKYFAPLYQEQYDFARRSAPFQNFHDCDDLRNTMIRSRVSIVIETYHERTDAVSLSEKIFRAIQVPRPWVLSGATGSVQKLRSLGFDVFDEYIDHEYDMICTQEDISRRDAMIIDQLHRIKSMNITQSVLDDWNHRYRNNIKILESWNQTWKKDLQQFLSVNFPESKIDY